MNWKESNIMVKGEYIQEILTWYEKNAIKVNRDYQRKLVWTLDEKKCFIETILKNYPVPLFLFVKKKENSEDTFEIIDGLQRLEAIISFIRNEFSVNLDGKELYFNLEVLSGKEQVIKDLHIEPKAPTIEYTICKNFMLYQLPVTTIEMNNNDVEDVFKRINSTGRKLSKQELRQAGVTGKFSEIVNEIASKLRGDYTESNVIDLKEMTKLSLNRSNLNYGIDVNNTFWIKNGIITEDGLRRSKDEEIITILLQCILSENKCGMGVKTLDKLYDEHNKMYIDNVKKLTDGEVIRIKSLFTRTFETLEKIFKDSESTFETLLFQEKQAYNKDLVFIVLFLSFMNLEMENYYLEGTSKICSVFKGLADREFSELIKQSKCKWDAEVRNHLVQRCKDVLRPFMVYNQKDPAWNSICIELLKKAAAESQRFDFKIGFHDLRDGRVNENVLNKCIQTLVAMTTTNPHEECFIVLGVADKKKDAQDYEQFYGEIVPKYNNFYVPGVDKEAIKYCGGVNEYLEMIQQIIRKNKCVSERVIQYILGNVDVMRYNDKSLIVLKLKVDRMEFYNGKLYERYANSNHEVKIGSDEYYALLEGF